jgi:hypothetical protein
MPDCRNKTFLRTQRGPGQVAATVLGRRGLSGCNPRVQHAAGIAHADEYLSGQTSLDIVFLGVHFLLRLLTAVYSCHCRVHRVSSVDTPCAAETGLKCRNVEKRINTVCAPLMLSSKTSVVPIFDTSIANLLYNKKGFVYAWATVAFGLRRWLTRCGPVQNNLHIID